MNLILLGSNIWIASQKLGFYGLEVGNKMTVIRLENGELVLISPIKIDRSDCENLDALGKVKHLVVPNLLLHDLHVNEMQGFYPDATLWGVDGFSKKRPDLQIDALLNKPGNFDSSLEYIPFDGLKTALPIWQVLDIKETVFCHKPSKTLIIADVAFNFDEHDPTLTRIIARLLGCYKILKPSLVEKWLSDDKAKIASSVKEILKWDFDRVVPAHGSIIEVTGKEEFKAAFEWFLSRSL